MFNIKSLLMEAFEELDKLNEAGSPTTIRCMHALYEDDDGYVCNVGVYADNLTEEEMEELLTEAGMSFVQCWEPYDTTVNYVPQLGEVINVFDVSDEDIEDVAEMAGKDPEEYKHVGFFESKSTITEATEEDPYDYGPYKAPEDPTLRVGDYIKAKRYPSDEKWYPGRVTSVTPDFVHYTISGWGFTKNGTAVRSKKAKQAFGNLRKRLLGEAAGDDVTKKAASKRFWSSATINRIDEVAFHTAFDDELEELGLLDLFDDEGRLNARKDYGRIAKAGEENPDSWAIRALKKLWGMEYRPKLYTNHETYAYEIPGSRWEAAHKVKEAERTKREAEQKAKEEEERAAKQAAWEAELATANELLKACLSKVDSKLIADYEAAAGVKAEEDIVIEDKYQLKLLFKTPGRYYKLENKDISNEATITKYLIRGLPTMVEYINNSKVAAEFKKIDIFKNNEKDVDAILLTQSGQLYEVGPNWQGDFIVRVPGARTGEPATIIDEPFEVIYTVTHWDDNNHSTRSDSHSSRNLSWNSKHVDEIKKFGNWVPDEDDYGIEYGYIGSSTETTKIENPTSTDYSHEPGIDSWAHIYQIDGATD